MIEPTSDQLKKNSVLIVDDDLFFTEVMKTELRARKLEVTAVNSIREGVAVCRLKPFDVVLLDYHLPDGGGLELAGDILAANDRAKIILVTAFPNLENAVEAIKKGVYDYVSKPVDLPELHAAIERALRTSDLEAVEQATSYRNIQEKQESVLLGFNRSFKEVHHLVRQAARTTAAVLITGETGTGKNVVARMIHHQSSEPNRPFISLNCAALPETLIESELFGVEKGAFTGATQSRKGIFELADGGTLFLDEIGEMPTVLQSKLLSALEDRQIRRIGGDRPRPVSVRIISATNIVPETAIADKKFRRDLFYRLSVIHIHLPPLRERREDIPELCDNFIKKLALHRQVSISPAEIRKLQTYDFPGNVRELRNIIERCLILQEGEFIYPSAILSFRRNVAAIKTGVPVGETNFSDFIERNIETNSPLEIIERGYILAMFDKQSKNLAHTASALEISLSTLKRKLREYGVR